MTGTEPGCLPKVISTFGKTPLSSSATSSVKCKATISLIRSELGVNMCLGASNVSFGLPQRHVLNAAFLPMAMAAGLTSAIMSTAPVCVESVRASDLLLGHDAWGANWIAAHRARQAAEKAAAEGAATPA